MLFIYSWLKFLFYKLSLILFSDHIFKYFDLSLLFWSPLMVDVLKGLLSVELDILLAAFPVRKFVVVAERAKVVEQAAEKISFLYRVLCTMCWEKSQKMDPINRKNAIVFKANRPATGRHSPFCLA